VKSILKLIAILLISGIYGCTDNLNQPQDISMFEKRAPITTRDSVKNRVPIYKALECLNLTREQKVIIDSIIRQERLCSIECRKEFNDNIKILRQEYKAKLEKFSGVERTDDVKKEIEIITFEFRQTQRDLEVEYRKKMTVCVKNTLNSIESYLRKDQLTLWNIWKATNKIPCDRVKP
jgi:hypothetical protein